MKSTITLEDLGDVATVLCESIGEIVDGNYETAAHDVETAAHDVEEMLEGDADVFDADIESTDDCQRDLAAAVAVLVQAIQAFADGEMTLVRAMLREHPGLLKSVAGFLYAYQNKG